MTIVRRAFNKHAHPAAERSDPRMQMMRQPVGPLIQLAVTYCRAVER